MDATIIANQTEREIVRLCQRGLDATSLLQRTARRLHDAVPYDAYCWGTIDPATLLVTSKVAEHFPAISPALFAEHEYLMEDINKLSALSRRSRPVGILGQITDGEPQRSARYRGILAPAGLEREMRAALVGGGSCWGGANLFRTADKPDFTIAEAALMARLSPHLAEGLRVAMLLGSAMPGSEGESPGVVLFDDGDAVAAVSPEAARWLADLPGAEPAGGVVPAAVYEVAVRARAVAEGTAAQDHVGLPARLRVRTRSQRWLVLHGVQLPSGEDRSRTAVIVEVARAPELAPLLLQAYDLSPREREVVRLVLGGQSTAEIAAHLFVSPFTVQDHLKAVFAKVGVRSRRELVARILGEQGFFAAGSTDDPASSTRSAMVPGLVAD
ncbi:MAG: LuxR C-terminal-related transcriptional regulator [Thermomicrobiales bacterium]